MSLNVTLVVVGGDVKTPEVKLRLPSTVGRGRDCSIMLRHPLVSRQHCEIFEASGALMVRDLGSLNGTFVNNQRIEGDAPLHSGQLLTIGTVTFRAMYEDAAAGGQPPAGPGPQMKTVKPSSETDGEGTVASRPATRKPTADSTVRKPAAGETIPQEPVDVEMDFDLDDAQPLFSEIASDKTKELPGKNGSAETIAAPNKAKPGAVTIPVAAKSPVEAKAAETKPTPPAKPADKAPAAPAAKPVDKAPDFGFFADDEQTDKAADDDDLNDFLKNLK
ncbi:ABC transporter ATP-binding/permease protein [Anatilimnocola aggregata]|uniref:ABC transporter ATP-binding/permease protein n=1 Tax=Anatilimnocola aggregata TaxID=2528021 RepID=A0A517Y9B6_9BACT|nr:FHA domain-containing protein [Anatilimnocola aggregata]QDU26820.1 ABC transporter ATP-binding/permease protein [Anatilimnocola aggregata]